VTPADRVDFHGRERELGFLTSEFEHASRGHPRTVLVTGDAGIGKSRLVREFTHRLPGRVLRGASHATLSLDLPYAPLAQALRPLTRSGALADLSEVERDGLAPVIPMLASGPNGPDSPDDKWGRSRAFELLLTVLGRLATDDPVTLVVEDLQWADHGTLDLLLFLTENLSNERVLLAGSLRSDEWVNDEGRRRALSHLTAHSQLVELRGLTDEDVGAILADLLPDVTAADRASVMARTHGNPFFVLEIAGSFRAGRPDRLPRHLTELLTLRLRALTPPAQRVVALAACCGAPVHHELLAAAGQLPPAELEALLRECVEAYVLRPVRRSSYEFRHALLEEFAYGDLLPGERSHLHRRVAETIETDPRLAGDPAQAAVALARHWRGAGEPARALGPMVSAAQTSRQRHSFGDAARLLAECRQLWQQVDIDGEVAGLDHAELLTLLADSLRWAGQPEEAEVALRAAIEEVRGEPDDPRLVALYVRLAQHLNDLGRGEEALSSAREACRLAGPGTALAAEADAALGAILVLQGDYLGARPALERALADSTGGGHAAERVYSLSMLGVALANTGALDEAVTVLNESLAAATAQGAAASIVRTCVNLSYVLEAAGRWEEAVRAARLGEDTARRSGLRGTVGALLAGNVASALLALGRVDETRGVVEEALEHRCPPTTWQHLTAELAEVEAVSGRLAEAEALVASLRAGSSTLNPITAAMVGSVEVQVLLARHRPAEAHAAAVATLTALGTAAEPTLGLRLCAGGLRSLADLAVAGRSADPFSAALDGDAALLLARAARFSAQSHDLPPAQEQYALCLAEDARRRGTDGPDDWAVIAERPGVRSQRLLEAYLLLRWADASRRTATRADRGALLQRAATVAAAAGAAPLLADVRRAAALGGIRLADAEPARDAVADELQRLRLTDREREVLELLGEGRSNRQIARRLTITEKTASVHVSHVLRKLGVRTRTEASVLLHRLRAVERGTS
jgi:DNA-binding CsgD family transcriptional regulator